MSHGAVHVAGMGMELLAQGWLVLLLTDSPLWVGIVSGARGAGHVGMGAFGGVLADRFNRRDLLAMVQLGRALAIGVLGFLVVTGHVELWHALVVALFQGMTDGIAAPSFNGLIYDTVGRERLLNGIAAFEGGAYLGWIAGALVFGAVITAAGVGAGLLVISGVYTASLVLLLPVRAHFSGGGGREPLWRTLREGLAYAATNRPVLTLLGLSVLVETFGFSFIIMLPVVARDVLEVGASGLGYLSASGSGGALLGGPGRRRTQSDQAKVADGDDSQRRGGGGPAPVLTVAVVRHIPDHRGPRGGGAGGVRRLRERPAAAPVG